MAGELTGRRVAFMVANEGMEQVEFTEPWQAVKDAGGTRNSWPRRRARRRPSITWTRVMPSRWTGP